LIPRPVIRIEFIAVLSALLLSAACGRKEEGADVTEPNVVPLSMALSVAGNYSPATKMSAEVAQAGEAPFRGMGDISIIPFNLSSGTQVLSNDTRHGSNIDLLQPELPYNSFGSHTDDGNFKGLITGSNSHLYGLVFIDRGVNAVLAYGKALNKTVAITDEDSLAFKQKNGVLNHPNLRSVQTPGEIEFRLEPILNAYKKETQFNIWRRDIVWYLNKIVETKVENKQVSPSVYYFNRMDAYDYPDDLKAAFDAFVAEGAVTPATKEVLDSRLTNLYRAVYPYSQEKRNSADFHTGTYYYVYELAVAILASMRDGKYVTIKGSGTWTSVTLNVDGPAVLGIPFGAYALQYREGSNARRFSEQLENKYTHTGERVGLFTADERCFTYPPSLYYLSNSQLKTTEQEDVSDYYRTETGGWDDIVQYYTEDGVTASSKSAVICEPLDYGVARMDLKIRKCTSPLKDANNDNVATNNNKYPLTGVLVSSQKNVDYRFKPKASSTQYIVYDQDVLYGSSPAAYISSTVTSRDIPILLLETEADTDVQLALEFKNNSGRTFRGINGCAITNGMHFYLLGKLLAGSGTAQSGQNLNSVLVADHVTSVTITVTGFQNAYPVLPDLREVQLTLGVDAEMDWDLTDPENVMIK